MATQTIFATQAVSTIVPSLARVICSDLNSTGSAFVIHEDGYLLTANHVISSFSLQNGALVSNYSNNIRVAIGGAVVPASIANDQSDLAPLVFDYAILKIDPPNQLTAATIDSLQTLAQGDPIICAGYPLNFTEPVVTAGIVSAVVRHPSVYNSLQIVNSIVTDAVMQFGCSGGPLVAVDSRHVVGINTRKHNQLDELTAMLQQAQAQFGPNDLLSRLIESIVRFRHLGFHHANSMEYALDDPAFPT